MSSTTDEIITFARSVYAVRIASSIALAILYFDYALTLRVELQTYWRARPTRAAWLYFANRGLGVLGNIPVIAQFYFVRNHVTYHQLFSGATQVVVAMLQIFRVYALYQSRAVLGVLLALVGMACAISGWAYTKIYQERYRTADADLIAQIGCDFRLSATQGHYLAIVWGSILIFDAAVFAFTINRMRNTSREWRGSLLNLMLRDGALYFGILVACHSANILTYLLAHPVYRGITVTATNVVSTTLMARVMLNVRDPAARHQPSAWPSESIALGVYVHTTESRAYM